MDTCVACDKASCDLVCMKKPADYARALLEVGGFGFAGISALTQGNVTEVLPRYVPTLQHTLEEHVPLEWVAVPLSVVMRSADRTYRPRAPTATELRHALGLAEQTKVVLLGTGKDRPIETYWRWRREHQAPETLARMGLSFAIAPNYSMWLNEPRTQHLYNRKRSLTCASEWSSAGVATVPYLSAIAPADFVFFEEFLREHHEVVAVAEEFQTGLANEARGLQTLDWLARVQDRLGRSLHPVAIGGAQYVDTLARRFTSWTIIDSMPFMRAVHRRIAEGAGRRIRWLPALGADPADLFFHNTRRYAEWVDRRVVAARGELRATRSRPSRSALQLAF